MDLYRTSLCRASRKMPRSPRLLHKAHVMQATLNAAGDQTGMRKVTLWQVVFFFLN